MATSGSEEKHILTIRWRIKNICLLGNVDYRCSVVSPIFRTRVLGGKKLRMVLSPKLDGGKDELVCLGLHMLDSPLDFPIDCEWAVIGSNKSHLFGKIERKRFKHTICLNVPSSRKYEDVFVTNKSEFLPQGNITVRCHIWKSSGNLPNSEFISGHSRYLELRESFLWTIPGLSSFQLNDEVTTPVKIEFLDESSRFELKFSLRGPSLEESVASVKLAAISIPAYLRVSTKVFVLGLEEKSMTSECTFATDSKETWILPQLVYRKELMERKSDFLRNDVLALRCEFIVINLYSINFVDIKDHGCLNFEVYFSKDVSTSGTSVQTSKKSPGTMKIAHHRKDVRKLDQHPRRTDFELLVGGISFPVHKNILSARSAVFKAMFSEYRSHHAPDLDVPTANLLLTYMYRGTLKSELQSEETTKLYRAADKYQVRSLMRHCSCILSSTLSVSSVAHVLKLAILHKDAELSACAYEYLIAKCDEVMNSKEWEKFMETDPHFAVKMMHLFYKRNLFK